MGNKKVVAGIMAGFCVLSSQTLVQYGLLVGKGGNSSSLQAFGESNKDKDKNVFGESNASDNPAVAIAKDVNEDVDMDKVADDDVNMGDDDEAEEDANRDQEVIVRDNSFRYRIKNGEATIVGCRDINATKITIFFDNINYKGRPYDVTGVAGNAFDDCRNLEEIEAPESVEIHIKGFDLYKRCGGINAYIKFKEVATLNKNNTYAGGEYRLYTKTETIDGRKCEIYCAKLKKCDKNVIKVKMPNSVKKGNQEHKVTGIEESNVFNGSNVETISLSQGANVEPSSFDGCLKLKEIKAYKNDRCLVDIDGVLYGITADDWHRAALLRYPCGKEGKTFTLPDGVTEIVSGSLDDSKIETIIFTRGGICVGTGAFLKMPNLKNIYVPEGCSEEEYGCKDGFCPVDDDSEDDNSEDKYEGMIKEMDDAIIDTYKKRNADIIHVDGIDSDNEEIEGKEIKLITNVVEEEEEEEEKVLAAPDYKKQKLDEQPAQHMPLRYNLVLPPLVVLQPAQYANPGYMVAQQNRAGQPAQYANPGYMVAQQNRAGQPAQHMPLGYSPRYMVAQQHRVGQQRVAGVQQNRVVQQGVAGAQRNRAGQPAQHMPLGYSPRYMVAQQHRAEQPAQHMPLRYNLVLPPLVVLQPAQLVVGQPAQYANPGYMVAQQNRAGQPAQHMPRQRARLVNNFVEEEEKRYVDPPAQKRPKFNIAGQPVQQNGAGQPVQQGGSKELNK